MPIIRLEKLSTMTNSLSVGLFNVLGMHASSLRWLQIEITSFPQSSTLRDELSLQKTFANYNNILEYLPKQSRLKTIILANLNGNEDLHKLFIQEREFRHDTQKFNEGFGQATKLHDKLRGLGLSIPVELTDQGLLYSIAPTTKKIH
uniref:Uncharacterized protein n=1 Tax=Glossina austeni TaxID=7395 RepID=A0A1A9UMP5_GLOAU